MRLFFCPSAVNETASGFRWVLFPAFGQHKEVMLLKHKCPSPRIGKKPQGNIGRGLYAAFLTATLSASLCQPASAATVWEKANEIMRDVYTQILGISTIAAIVTTFSSRRQRVCAAVSSLVSAPDCRFSKIEIFAASRPITRSIWNSRESSHALKNTYLG